MTEREYHRCHRDVRTVDLPPRLGISVQLLTTDINELPQPPPPSADAPAVTVLLTGANSVACPSSVVMIKEDDDRRVMMGNGG